MSTMQRQSAELSALRLRCRVQTRIYWTALAAVVGVAIYVCWG